MAGNLRGPLPFMKTMEDAVALCQKEGDPFYLTAFVIEAWLGQARLAAAAEYAEKKSARDRQMQSGMVWRLFLGWFGHAKDEEFGHIFSSLLRFAEYDDVQAVLLRRAFVPLAFEAEGSNDFVGSTTMALPLQPRQAVALMRRTVERWCDWIDAVVHDQTHTGYHLSSEKFDPDPEKRELAVLGANQRLFSGLSEFSQAWWHWHFGEAAERFKGSPKWPTVGQAMAAQQIRTWNYPALDGAIITFWPLLKRHNWTYRDLLNVVCQVAPRLGAYPCQRVQDFSTYCVNVLGLRKSRKGRTAPDGKPPGWQVALRLCGRQP